MLEQAARKLNFYFSMSFFGLGALLVNIICWILCLLPGSQHLERTGKRINHWMMRIWMWHLNSTWVTQIDFPQIMELREMRGVILVSNHPNLLDICWILAASPRVTCYTKADIRRNNFYNACSRLAGYLPNDSGIEGLHNAIERVRSGDVLCIFPEGTRTQTPPLNPLKPGFALISKVSGAPLQLLFIESNTRCFTKGVFFHPGTLPIRYKVRLGPQILPNDAESPHELARRVEKAMRLGLAAASMQQ